MSKELDKVKKISDMVLYNADGYATLPNEEVNLLIAIANQALHRLEAIDNAEPSEALEEIKTLRGFNQVELNNDENVNKSLDTINQALLKEQEEHRALEIIKEKRIDIESFYSSFIESDYDYNFYEIRYGTYGKYCLTEEEFNLLKEVLE